MLSTKTLYAQRKDKLYQGLRGSMCNKTQAGIRIENNLDSHGWLHVFSTQYEVKDGGEAYAPDKLEPLTKMSNTTD